MLSTSGNGLKKMSTESPDEYKNIYIDPCNTCTGCVTQDGELPEVASYPEAQMIEN